MADKAAPTTLAGLTLPSWAVTLVVTILISAAASWGTFQYARGRAEADTEKKFSDLQNQVTNLKTQADASSAYIQGEKDRKDEELREFQKKRNEYTERMETLLDQYQRAAPLPK